MRRDDARQIRIIILNVVDNFFIAGSSADMEWFHKDTGKRFKIGKFVRSIDLVLNRLHIHQDVHFNVTLLMEEYLTKKESIPLSRSRQKRQIDKCSAEEKKLFQALAG